MCELIQGQKQGFQEDAEMNKVIGLINNLYGHHFSHHSIHILLKKLRMNEWCTCILTPLNYIYGAPWYVDTEQSGQFLPKKNVRKIQEM